MKKIIERRRESTMTIEELYNWAIEKKCSKHELKARDFFGNYCLLDDRDLLLQIDNVLIAPSCRNYEQ